MKTLILQSAVITLLIVTTVLSSCKKENDPNQNNPDDPKVFPDCGTVTDIDGNTYNTIKIGNQCWMRENLKVTHYRNGDPIPTTATPDESISSEEFPKYQWSPDGNETYLNTYGRVYNYFVTTDERNLCPTGWHVPSDNEWKTLEMELGMTEEEANKEGSRGHNIGSMLAGGESLWTHSHSSLVINEFFGASGFDGLPGGGRNSGGSFVTPGFSNYWWTNTPGLSTEYDSSAYARYINYESSSVRRLRATNKFGFYVRCVKD